MRMSSILVGLSFLFIPALLGSPEERPFFPQGLFYESPESDGPMAKLASRYMEAAGEDSLFGAMVPGETYRLLWLPSFNSPVIVRVTMDGDVNVRVAEFSGVAPTDTPTIREKAISMETWRCLQTRIEESGFWEGLENEPIPAGLLVLDGSRWILEGVKNGKYRAIQRFSPEEDRPGDQAFLRSALALFELGDVDLEEEDIY